MSYSYKPASPIVVTPDDVVRLRKRVADLKTAIKESRAAWQAQNAEQRRELLAAERALARREKRLAADDTLEPECPEDAGIVSE